MRLAVDIGGTFTDVVLEIGDPRRGGRRLTCKVLTTPRAPEEAVMAGTRAILADSGRAFADIDVFVHGTTLATNAIIERKGARTALIATEGFRDTLEIAYESRYDQYDVFIEKPRQLVPRALRFTVPERMDVQGRVRLPLDEAAVRALVPTLAQKEVGAIAVAFLHAYANPAHERRTREILLQELPALSVTLSCEACPEVREYDRTSTAVANAYIQPLMAGYLARLRDGFAAEGFHGMIYLMTSGGGLTALETARRFPIRLVESGPAGGAILAANAAAERGEDKVLSFDMGGTTAKICLIQHYTPFKSRSFEVDRAARFLKGSGLPLRVPVIEMVEIGAGGGSLARIDALKRIVVGPESAGAEPGPASYGRGGTRPTVTDADVVLGKIDPARFAGGTIHLDVERARQALDAAIGAELALASEMAAYGVGEIVDENMANAARVHAVERGAVIGEHTMIAFGGAAPLHAARLAEKLGLQRIVVPPNAGVGSAVGFLQAPVAYELIHSRYMRLDGFDPAAANALIDEMAREAHALVAPGARGQAVVETRVAYMRYVGQGHEITVPLPARPLDSSDTETLRRAFEREYAVLFERHIPDAAIEALSWSVTVATEARRPTQVTPPARRPAPRPVGARAFFDARQSRHVEVPVYWRSDLQPGATIPGPAIIAEDETSTFVSPAFDAWLDAAGGIVLERKPAG
ncbi:hydantoinase/oxoprolinase family protein [Vineibacter terrae]|uniref:Hydantoinase/oxoprolinase family protein n=1 Tax=Vineibacter terrae TaxID=2586908 RepID=A0A5C8PIW2_9HYPH|nr:hydantoinase/oxoprolinase family protein [Vineibacter terrae]